jgi:hypothetical protein
VFESANRFVLTTTPSRATPAGTTPAWITGTLVHPELALADPADQVTLDLQLFRVPDAHFAILVNSVFWNAK